ncbi:MAG: hypothetical protein LBT47_08135 [Deltaproteobacteria bacterium]|jgi:hypothetical protein|nr:hypothetical protein [Deltaproteobacteria bacterium]
MTKIVSSLLSLFAAIVFCSSLAMAQVPQLPDAPVTDADIDLFIKLSETDANGQAQLLSTQADPTKASVAYNKIVVVATYFSQNMDTATLKTALSANPAMTISDEDLAVIEARKADVVAAFKKLTGL